jgi:CBS domain-containing protein
MKPAMKIEDVMTRRVVAARADTDLSHVARLMWDNDCGTVPVVDAEDRVVGILTDRDLSMSANFSGKALRELRAASCMASEIESARPSETLMSVAERMGARRVRRIPVTDDGGRLVGIVSVGDLLAAAARAGAKERKELHGALLTALTLICARPAPEQVPPALPSKKKARASAKGARPTKSSAKKRPKL